MLDDGNTYVHVHSDKNVYVGGEAGKGSFDFLATLSGPVRQQQGQDRLSRWPAPMSPTSG